jgi:hypothetical protein
MQEYQETEAQNCNQRTANSCFREIKVSYPTDHSLPESIAARSICWESSRTGNIGRLVGKGILVVLWAERAVQELASYSQW